MGEKSYNSDKHKTKSFASVVVVASCVIAFAILVMVLAFFFINQSLLVGRFDEAVDIYKTMLTRTRDLVPDDSTSGNGIVEQQLNDVEDQLMTLRMEYLNTLSDMHKQSSANDLFAFIYGFLSSVLIGVSAYFIKKGEKQLNDLSKKCDVLSISASKVDEKIKEGEKRQNDLSKKYDKLKKTYTDLENSITAQKDELGASNFSLILSEGLRSIEMYKDTLDQDYLVRFSRDIKHLANMCEQIKVKDMVGQSGSKLGQRFSDILKTYKIAAEKDGSEISEDYRRGTDRDLSRISEKMGIT